MSIGSVRRILTEKKSAGRFEVARLSGADDRQASMPMIVCERKVGVS